MQLKLLGSLALSALLFSACSIKTVPYHSDVSITADKKIEFRSINTVTDFTVVAAGENDYDYPDFGVISALDNGTYHYNLIVPTFDEAQAKGNGALSMYNLDHAIALTDAHATELIAVIDLALADWGLEYSESKGKNLAYTVLTDQPTFDFHYQNNKSGSIASVIVATGKVIQVEGDGGITHAEPIAYTYEITSASELQGFKDLLTRSTNPASEEISVPIEDQSSEATPAATQEPVTEETSTQADDNATLQETPQAEESSSAEETTDSQENTTEPETK